MKKLYYSAFTYMVLGLAAGVFYREFTKINNFTGESELSVLHTHLLSLGMLFFLGVMALEKLFNLSGMRLFSLFFWFYTAGMVVSIGMMTVIGIMNVTGTEVTPMFAGIAGLGHILLTLGLIHLFLALGKRIRSSTKPVS